MHWGKPKNPIREALAAGDFQQAAEYLQRGRFRNTLSGRRVARKLTAALVEHAETSTSAGNLNQAWTDLTTAGAVALPTDADLISRKKNQLVELTVETAETYLASGKITHAIRSIDELTSRNIMDWRADRISQTAGLLRQADDSAATGNLETAVKQLEQAKQLRPELDFIEARLSANRQRQMQLRDLTSELRDKTIRGDWSGVNACCQKLLEIAPKYQVALDAQKHCLCQMRRKTFTGMRATHIPTKPDSFFQILESDSDAAIQFLDDPSSDDSTENTFLLWVDGVGGYLVCAAPRNVIGQALPNSSISIPVQGDLRQRHARLETVEDRHLLQFLGASQTAGYAIDQPLALRNGQTIDLAGGVRLKYTQAHPLSSTARLDFVSRHRTQPWSDAILLAGQTIVLGPNPNNHVYCPTWEHDLILFRRPDDHPSIERWYGRYPGKLEIDGREYDREGPIGFNSRITTDDFSLSLEPAFAPRREESKPG